MGIIAAFELQMQVNTGKLIEFSFSKCLNSLNSEGIEPNGTADHLFGGYSGGQF